MYDNEEQGEAGEEDSQTENKTTKLEEETLRAKLQERIDEIKEELSLIKTRLAQKKRSNDDKLNDSQQQALLREELPKAEQLLAVVTGKIKEREELECKIWCQSLDIVLFLLQNTNQVMREG